MRMLNDRDQDSLRDWSQQRLGDLTWQQQQALQQYGGGGWQQPPQQQSYGYQQPSYFGGYQSPTTLMNPMIANSLSGYNTLGGQLQGAMGQIGQMNMQNAYQTQANNYMDSQNQFRNQILQMLGGVGQSPMLTGFKDKNSKQGASIDGSYSTAITAKAPNAQKFAKGKKRVAGGGGGRLPNSNVLGSLTPTAQGGRLAMGSPASTGAGNPAISTRLAPGSPNLQESFGAAARPAAATGGARLAQGSANKTEAFGPRSELQSSMSALARGAGSRQAADMDLNFAPERADLNRTLESARARLGLGSAAQVVGMQGDKMNRDLSVREPLLRMLSGRYLA